MSSTSGDTPSFAGSSLLRQLPPFRPPSHTGPGGADLSLSELYISDRSEDSTVPKPFSLLPQRDTHDKEPEHDEDQPILDQDAPVDETFDELFDEEDAAKEKGKRSLNEARATREERLQHDLFVLKKLNASFSVYNESLKDVRSSSEVRSLSTDCTLTSSQNVCFRTSHSNLIGQVVYWTSMSICCNTQKTTRGLYLTRPGKEVRR